MGRKKGIFYFSIFFISIFLAGYYVVRADYYMPKTMPADFAFKITFGVEGKNEINTFRNTITKDLLKGGKTSGTFTFTKEEMEAIYKKMKKINIIGHKELSPSPFYIQIGEKPIATEHWEIRLDGHYIQLENKEYANKKTTKDAQQLLELHQWIFELVKQKDEFQKLPDAREGFAFYDGQ
ncbi:MAG TPA: hypothetical protein DDY49_04760 [Paenibacillaceae bacterium]|nr:hypothetical protein [Paenibacillaceae bacterium]